VHVQAVVDEMVDRGLAPKTVRTNYGVPRATMRWATDRDMIDRSPFRTIRLPQGTGRRAIVVSADDVELLAAAMPEDYRIAVYLGAPVLRQGEVFGLRVGKVDLVRRTITMAATINEVEGRIVEGHGKTAGSRRTFSIPQHIADELNAHLTRTGRTAPGDLVLQAPRASDGRSVPAAS
jgi:integrase